jgi:hypothetical protein
LALKLINNANKELKNILLQGGSKKEPMVNHKEHFLKESSMVSAAGLQQGESTHDPDREYAG